MVLQTPAHMSHSGQYDRDLTDVSAIDKLHGTITYNRMRM